METKFFLATTRLEEFWDKTKKIIFLTNACIPTKTSLDIEYNGDGSNEDDILKKKIYLEGFCEELLLFLSKELNRIHKEDHSIEYWRIILFPWIKSYVVLIYDRYRSIERVLRKYKNITSTGMDARDYIVLNNFDEMANIYYTDAYNLQVYSKLLKLLGVNINEKRYRWPSSQIEPALVIEKENLMQKLKRKIFIERSIFNSGKTILNRLFNRLTWLVYKKKSGRIVFLMSQINKNQARKLICKSRFTIIPYYNERSYDNDLTLNVDWNLRAGIKSIGKIVELDDFKNILSKIIIEDIPLEFIENYKIYSSKNGKFGYRNRPQAILGDAVWWDRGMQYEFIYWAAYWAEQGVPLLDSQHGGAYGINRNLFTETHERKIARKFYSWGWEGDNVKPMPALKLAGRPIIGADNSKHEILFGTTGVPLYLNILELYMLRYNINVYFDDQYEFFKALNERNKTVLTIRTHPHIRCWDYIKKWKEKNLTVKICGMEEEFFSQLSRCKIYICDHIETTFLESLAADIPTILFFRTEFYPLTKQSKPYFEGLRRVGILCDSANSAAYQVNKVYNDVEKWWNNKDLQNERRKFCEHYARMDENVLNLWIKELNTFCRDENMEMR